MSRNIIPAVVLAALASYSALAHAEDPPAIVGRISSVQGQVTLVGDGEPVGAALNWPVTADNHLNTSSGARTEFRVGSTAVRLDSDSDLEIVGMDDDLLRLRLNYGSVSIRVRSAELLRDFELSTPQARITMLEPGILRVDVDRQPDTSQVTVLAGSARVEGAGSSVVVNNGRHVDITPEDVRTSVARRDGFDVWAEDRDRLDSATTTTRFVSSGITGYEELDRNGSWADNVEYGPLWTPRNVALDWAPYRDGRWIWLAPWGWTWVDNAPWGYAPSHYGRWVLVERRWRWAPGRPAGRPVWAPALVGWVGGNGGPHRPGPGLGWYPLSPRDRFVPNYRVSSDYERRVTWTHNGKPLTPRPNVQPRRDGLTVLPREQFEGRRNVNVGRGAQVLPPPAFVKNVTPVAPPQPQGPHRPLSTDRGGRGDRDHDGIPDRFDRDDGRPGRGNERPGPGRVITAPSQPQQVPAQQPPGRISTLAPNQFGQPDAPTQHINPNDMRLELRPRPNWQPGQPRPQQQPSPQMPQPVLQVSPPATPRDRADRDDDNRRVRAQEERRQQWQQQQQQQQQQQLQPRPQPQQQLQPPREAPPPRQVTPPPAPAQQASPPRQFTPPPTPAPQAQPPAQREQRHEPRSEPRNEPRREPERRREDNNNNNNNNRERRTNLQ